MPELEGSSKLFFGPWYRKSPYFEASRRYGPQSYDIYNHMYLPGPYADPEDEYWHLVEHVTMWDVGVERQVEISGKDALAFTDYLTPRDLTKCDVGQGKYVVITAADGGIINDPVLMRVETDRFWLSLANSDVLLWAKGVAVNSDFDVDITEPDVSPMQLQGPKSKDVARALFGPKVLDLPYYYFLDTKVDGIPVVVTRTGWTAEVGYEIYLRDGSKGEALWERVLRAGKPFGIRPIAPSEIRRIEAGILNYGSDMTLENNPYEVGLGWLVDEGKKADYVGKKALAKIKREGVKRKLVGVEIHGPRLAVWLDEFWDVRADRTTIGRLTALTYSPRLTKNIGYALVPVRYAKLGTKLTVATPVGDRDATVVRKPFIDPKKDIPKS
ncbi:MAG: glycine cleavage T C-terminal barrel domain-containing protein [Methanobacteriota archaeon]